MDKNIDNQKTVTYEIIHSIITTMLIPAFGYLLMQLNDVKKEFSDYKVAVTQELGNKVYRADLDRLETKIDDLRNLVISELIKPKK